MTEDLLAFVTVIAIWKIVQVVMLKRKLKQVHDHSAAVIRRAMDDTRKLEKRVDSFMNEPQLGRYCAAEEWPAEIE